MSPCDSISSSGSVIGNRALCAGFFSWQVNIAVVRWGFCADYVVKFASPSCVRFIYFGFLLATTCVWVWMVCSLHSVTTGSRDRANVSLIIIIIISSILSSLHMHFNVIFGEIKNGGFCKNGITINVDV